MKTMNEEGKSCDHLKPDTTNHGKLNELSKLIELNDCLTNIIETLEQDIFFF
jgi:hypothetical protein